MRNLKFWTVNILMLTLFFAFSHAGTHTVNLTAYTSTVGQTDSTPFRTSIGARVHHGGVAASPDIIRRYGYGAKVKITRVFQRRGCNPTYLRSRNYVINDTTNARYSSRVDVWFQSYRSAINFGRCVASVEILRR